MKTMKLSGSVQNSTNEDVLMEVEMPDKEFLQTLKKVIKKHELSEVKSNWNVVVFNTKINVPTEYDFSQEEVPDFVEVIRVSCELLVVNNSGIYFQAYLKYAEFATSVESVLITWKQIKEFPKC